ncbi:VIT domain-containing protein [Roseibacillus persicicus]|uniref:VIT domain-containing protein n=1 Tax=Roseibacillus persicicus TaxID=454148 RepID=UPI0028103988|nr:VIT domain-containing protein [Roseibacillus persicicus]MDQ8189155.1 VIT domain-containing protein [Roseibacillus persicicus]
MISRLTLCLLHLVLLFPISGAEIRAPQIVCRDARNNPFPLDLQRYAVEIERHQDLVETTLTLTFNNETYRLLEGELLLPLPEHATISGYALEVNSAFREAVAVEKKRARLAYETIKARRVDPGIVEKEADGIYRTRIYPILGRSTKSVRISYLEYLPITGPSPFRPTYHLAFNLTSEVDNISVLVKNPGEDLVTHPSLEFLKNSHGHLEAILQNKTLDGKLTIEATDPHHSVAATADQAGGLAYLTLNSQFNKDAQAPVPHPAPKRVALLWDASRSMSETNFEKVLSYLDAFFQAHPNLTVSLSLLRNVREKGGEFQIWDGEWKELRKAIAGVTYDGSSNYSNLQTNNCDLNLLVTDGLATQLPPHTSFFKANTPYLALATRPISALHPLSSLTYQTGGRVLDLQNMEVAQAIALTRQRAFRLPLQSSNIRVYPLPSRAPFVHRFLLKERFGNKRKLKLALDEMKVTTETLPPRWLSHLYGVTELQRLESSDASPSQIIDHCEEYTLASDLTSLIVLENFADHIEFEIPPPEADLREKYYAKLKERRQQSEERLTYVWSEVLQRHRMKAPGIEVLIYNELSKIQKFNEAQRYAFQAEQLDPSVRKAFLDWEREAMQLLATRKEASKQAKIAPWKQELLRLRIASQELTQKVPAARSPLAVSIRGLVRKPGTIEFQGPTTLKQALVEAGASKREDLSRVSLYRSGTKKTYNTLSKAFRDFPLLPGDMVVVEGLNRSSSFADADPFANSDPFSSEEPVDRAAEFEGQPAVVEAPSAGSLPARQISESVFTRDLNAFGVEAETSQEATESHFDPVPIAAQALYLFRKGEEAAAERHLSNLRELFPHRSSALRLEALCHWQMGELLKAETTLKEALEINGTDYLAANLIATIALHKGKDSVEKARQIYRRILNSAWGRDEFLAQTILLTDRNALLTGGPSTVMESKLPKDLRIVVTNLQPDPSFQLTIQDPTSFRTGHAEISPTGVVNISTVGLHEITDREVVAGKYQLEGRCDRDQLLVISTYEKFSSSQQKASHEVILLQGGGDGQLLKAVSFD